MEEQVLVSVIIPVYNAEKYLSQCLDSVLGQTLREMEVICVDDGSTDESPAILQSYAAKDHRVHLLKQQNRFAGVARNSGMDHARGKYVAFLDSDDFYMDKAVLADLLPLAEKHSLDVLKGSFSYLDESTGRTWTSLYSTNAAARCQGRERLLSLKQTPQPLLQVADVPWNALYRRDFLQKHGIYFNHLRCVNDRSFRTHCLLKAERVMVTNRQMVYYRVGLQSSLIGRKAEHFDCQLEAYAITRALCADQPESLRQAVLQRELYSALEWYCQLLPQAADPAALEGLMRRFLASFDESDVGEAYLRAFPFTQEYYRLRYGQPSPGTTGARRRFWNAMRAYGPRYMALSLWEKMQNKLRG